MKTITYFRHTFICPECENCNYRVTANFDPCVSFAFIDCGSCGKRISMNTHHATDVCLPPVFDIDLIASAIILAAYIGNNSSDELICVEDLCETAQVHIKILKESMK